MRWKWEDKTLRIWFQWIEIFYLKFEFHGLMFEVEFPSDWHEVKIGWFRFSPGFFNLGIAFPWKWVVPDEYQCSGPQFGFAFFEDGLHLHWGKAKGRPKDPNTIIQMPWGWRHKKHEILSEPETHDYEYRLNSGVIQQVKATIYKESREWRRPWLPWRQYQESIEIEFSDEVGERTGSWKGGCIGCGYDMLPGETPLQALRRMEGERSF